MSLQPQGERHRALPNSKVDPYFQSVPLLYRADGEDGPQEMERN